jgi:serine/threonine protein kinase
MTSEPREPSSSDPTADELRLGELLERFEELREENPSVGIGLLREEAGPLFPDLLDLADGLRLIRVRLGEEEDVPAAVGRYRILERIAAGAVGVVYRAEDPRSGQVVAVKVMHESLSMSREALTRFQREVAATQNLGHDHVVRTLGCGESDGRLYLVMEYVEGVALGDVLRRIREEAGPRPDERWLAILDEAGVPPVETPGKNAAETYARRLAALLAPAADALRVAAEAGLVHRDLKPANLLLRRDGKLLVTDFGIAKIDGEDITSTVAVLGTPRFMSPEQASGDSRGVDARTDVYGLGAVLYHALTLEHPVSGDTFEELLAAIVHQRPVPVAERCAAYPRGLSWLVSRCLEKDPDDRYPTAGTLADDLGRIARGERPLAARLPLTRRATRFLRGNRIVPLGRGRRPDPRRDHVRVALVAARRGRDPGAAEGRDRPERRVPRPVPLDWRAPARRARPARHPEGLRAPPGDARGRRRAVDAAPDPAPAGGPLRPRRGPGPPRGARTPGGPAGG